MGFKVATTAEVYEELHSNGASASSSVDRIKAITGELKNALESGAEGDVYEFGVYKGSTSLVLAVSLAHPGINKKLYLYDTFEGMPKGDPEVDTKIKISRGPLPEGALAFSEENLISFVEEKTAKLTGKPPAFTTIKGDIRETYKGCSPIAFAVMDVDYYDTTKFLYDTMAPNLSVGGVVYVDDYFNWEGARKATDEFLDKNTEFEGYLVRPKWFFIRRKLKGNSNGV